MSDNLNNHPHKRFNILTGEWGLVSPHRTQRPWQGNQEITDEHPKVTYDPHCYLCPSNTRANGIQNNAYERTFVFKNDFGALLEHTPLFDYNEGLLIAKGEKGVCKVVCFSPDHSLTIPEMHTEDLVQVIETWQREFEKLNLTGCLGIKS